MATGKITIELKQREVEVLAAYVASLKSKPDVSHSSFVLLKHRSGLIMANTQSSQVDMAKFMQARGYGTTASAQVHLGKVLRKVFKGEGGGEGTPPKKAGGKKRETGESMIYPSSWEGPADDVSYIADEDDAGDMPVKTASKANSTKAEDEETEEGQETKDVKAETAEDDF